MGKVWWWFHFLVRLTSRDCVRRNFGSDRRGDHEVGYAHSVLRKVDEAIG